METYQVNAKRCARGLSRRDTALIVELILNAVLFFNNLEKAQRKVYS